MAAYHGTLAAVRCLGAEGIRVTVAESSRFVPAVWSRFVARRVHCPGLEQSSRFVEWLLDFGAREPGYVLYPTSDPRSRSSRERSRHILPSTGATKSSATGTCA